MYCPARTAARRRARPSPAWTRRRISWSSVSISLVSDSTACGCRVAPSGAVFEMGRLIGEFRDDQTTNPDLAARKGIEHFGKRSNLIIAAGERQLLTT